ncbi:MAG: tRNA pseudouridine synthase A [Chitinophagaceae bacterium]
MKRFFLEVAYKGTDFSGFQKQINGITIQGEIEKAIQILEKTAIELTGSSRTDAGVHALQNFFHFDFDGTLHTQFIYKMNAILPASIVLKSLREVTYDAHCRFQALGRQYRYRLYTQKNPFLKDTAYFFPYALDQEKLKKSADLIKSFVDFTSFSKQKTQVRNFDCQVKSSEWFFGENEFSYQVSANRFLRGMVKGLTGTMLQIGRGKLQISDLEKIFLTKKNSATDFSVPSHGLFLEEVLFPDSVYR